MTMKRKTLALTVGGAALLATMGATGVVLADGNRHGGPYGAMGGGMIGAILDHADADGDGALSRDEIEAFRDSRFLAMDTDGDTALTPAELSDGMRALMFDAMDTDGSDTLDRKEFLAHADTRRLGGKRFHRMDGDGDGRIDQAEMATMTERMLARMDKNGDGTLDADELDGVRRGHRR